tara:strand:- start:1433 stop:1534 length:102 start_codon:yes stop_codon:yes gene_type:complete
MTYKVKEENLIKLKRYIDETIKKLNKNNKKEKE